MLCNVIGCLFFINILYFFVCAAPVLLLYYGYALCEISRFVGV